MRSIKLFLFFLIFIVAGCGSFIKIGIKGASPVFNDLIKAAYRIDDPQLLKDALPASLLILEGMIEVTPDNFDLLVLASQGYSGYAMAFVEDESPERAKKLYARGRDFGLRALKQCRKFRNAIEKNQLFEDAVKYLDEDYLPAMFWTASNWAALVNLSRRDTSMLFELPSITALMERIRELDDRFFYGSIHMLYGLYYINQPALTGGGPEKAREEFETVFKISEDKFLMAHVLYAKYYAGAIKDEALFESELKKVLDTPSDVLPDAIFLNEVAKLKASNLLKRKKELF